MGQQKQAYIHRIAAHVMKGAKIDWPSDPWSGVYVTDEPDFPQVLWTDYGPKIVEILGRMGPAARGRIAACGVSSFDRSGSLCHWQVNHGEMLNTSYSGDELLTLLAAYVVVAAIVDISRAETRREREREQRDWAEEEAFDRAMADYVHYGPNGPGLRS